MSAPTWQTTEFREATSYLTGRKLLINTGDRFLVPPAFSAARVRLSVEEFNAHVATMSARRKPEPSLRRVIAAFKDIQTVEEFGSRLERLLRETKGKIPTSSDPTRAREFLIRLWHNGALVWPIFFSTGLFKLTRAWGWGEAAQRILTDFSTTQPSTAIGKARSRALGQFLLTCTAVKELGDLTPDVIGPYLHAQMKISTLRQSTAADLLRLQQSQYPQTLAHTLGDFGSFGRPPTRSDDTFHWALKQDSTLGDWIKAMIDYMATLTQNRIPRRTTLNRFLDYLIANPSISRQPIDYARNTYTPPVLYVATNVNTGNALAYFFEFLLDSQCVDEDDMGYKVRLPGFRNPFGAEPRQRRSAETHRDAMPTRFVRMLHDIIVEDDFAWPRKYGISRWNRKGGDMAKWLNPATGIIEEVWSPVRADAILLKLLLPARTFQCRMLDSGEADTEEYQPENGQWVRNDGILAPGHATAKVAKGVFCRYQDRDGQEYVFLRFNTNKTADVDQDPSKAGYVMPWQHAEAIQLMADLRDWQKRYNPLSAPTPWADIKDMSISTRYTREVLAARGSNCFLFRDACSPFKDQPVTDMRLTTFWRNLNLELERRLAVAGETLPDGSPIKLVEMTASGPGPTTYDLHTLRVTLITALAESGVPPSILMKVVGHACVIMTLYYTKLTPVHICEQLNAGELKLHNQEQLNWQKWLTQQSRETLLTAAAYAMPSAVEMLASNSPTSWVVRDHGICPVGCSRCHEGGEPVIDTAAYQKWGPVPGGATNCVRCRFFISGPPFLLGLQSHFDNLSFRLREASEKYQASKRHFEELETSYRTRQSQHQPLTQQELHQLNTAAGHFDQRTKEVDELALSWHAAYRLVQQCLAILKTPIEPAAKVAPPQYALVATGGMANVEAVLQECPDFELMDRVCQSAVFFEGIDPTLPNLKRMRVFDAMLRRNGYDPVFIDMKEQDALQAGNQMAAFLFSRFGRDAANALMAGKETLRRLGIEDEVVKKLKTVFPIRLISSRGDRDVENEQLAPPKPTEPGPP